MPLCIPICYILKLNVRVVGFIFLPRKENAVKVRVHWLCWPWRRWPHAAARERIYMQSAYHHAMSVTMLRYVSALLLVSIMTTDQWEFLVWKILWSKGLPTQ